MEIRGVQGETLFSYTYREQSFMISRSTEYLLGYFILKGCFSLSLLTAHLRPIIANW